MGIHMRPFSKKNLKIKIINLGFNWGDLGLIWMGIHMSPFPKKSKKEK